MFLKKNLPISIGMVTSLEPREEGDFAEMYVGIRDASLLGGPPSL